MASKRSKSSKWNDIEFLRKAIVKAQAAIAASAKYIPLDSEADKLNVEAIALIDQIAWE